MRSQVVGGAARAAAVVAVLAAALAGCGTGPSQVGSAVIVGDATYPVDAVQAQLDAAFARKDVIDQLAAQGVGGPEIARDLVTQAVLHELTDRAAAREHIVVTPADIDAQLAEQGGVAKLLGQWLFDEPLLRERVGDELVAQQLAAKYVNSLAATVDVVGVESKARAVDVARVLAAGGPAAQALFRENPQTSRTGIEYRASVNPEVAASPVFGTPTGGVGYFQPDPDRSSWIVYRVTARRSDAPPVPLAADTVASIGDAGLAQIGIRLLQPVAAEAGVRVNPRYGVWDPTAMRVVGKDQASGAILP